MRKILKIWWEWLWHDHKADAADMDPPRPIIHQHHDLLSGLIERLTKGVWTGKYLFSIETYGSETARKFLVFENKGVYILRFEKQDSAAVWTIYLYQHNSKEFAAVYNVGRGTSLYPEVQAFAKLVWKVENDKSMQAENKKKKEAEEILRTRFS